MVICVCNALSESDIRQKAAEGIASFDALRDETGCSGCCGCCEDTAREVFAAAQASAAPRPFALAASVAIA